MIWIAPSEKDTVNDALEKRLWAAADQFRANSGLSAAQYSQPVLGFIRSSSTTAANYRSAPRAKSKPDFISSLKLFTPKTNLL
jgi:hypothetical protein